MEPFEVSVDGELFRIGERVQPGGARSYDFTWLNGPAEGTYGFMVGQFTAAFGDHRSEPATPLTRDQLVQEVREFVKAFYEPGGMGDDFPDHVPARTRPSTSP